MKNIWSRQLSIGLIIILVCLHSIAGISQERNPKRKRLKIPLNAKVVFAVSGGGGPTSNHGRYYDNIERVHTIFGERPILNYVSTGNPNDKVTMVYEKAPYASGPVGWTADKIQLDDLGRPVLKPMVPVGGFSGAAKEQDIQSGMESFFAERAHRKKTDSPLIFYVTDHGSMNAEGKGSIVLWDKTYLFPEQLNKMLDRSIPKQQKVILLMDQCYGGSMLKAMKNEDGSIRPNICGIAAAHPDQLAYSGGGTMRNLQKLVENTKKERPLHSKSPYPTYKDLYQQMVKDSSIRSIPTLSSDLYAQDWYIKKFGTDVLSNLQKGLFFDADKQCVLPQDLQTFRDTQTRKSSIPEPLLLKIQAIWKDVYHEFSITPGRALASSLFESVKEEAQNSTHVMKEYNLFLADYYNPLLLKTFISFYPEANDFQNLKEKRNAGKELDDQEKAKMRQYIKDFSAFQTAFEDEGDLRSKVDPSSLYYKNYMTEEFQTIYKKYSELRQKRSNSMIDLQRKNKKLMKLYTLNAIDQMMRQQDVKALEQLLNIIECESTPIFRSNTHSQE